jgi:hypothetical protein
MRKRKHDDIKLEDVRTIDDEIKYNLMLQRKWEELDDAPPSAIIDFDMEFPIHLDKPWTRPGWAAEYARAEEAKQRIFKREAKRQTNRIYIQYLNRIAKQREAAGLPFNPYRTIPLR